MKSAKAGVKVSLTRRDAAPIVAKRGLPGRAFDGDAAFAVCRQRFDVPRELFRALREEIAQLRAELSAATAVAEERGRMIVVLQTVLGATGAAA